MKRISIQRVQHGSAEYDLSVQLRREVLRWPLGLDFSDEDLEQEKSEIVLCAFSGESLVGTLNLAVVVSPNGLKMRQVAVHPDVQGTGIGRKLVDVAEQIAQQAEAGFIKLHARDTAVPFYLALGYSVEGDAFEEVGIPHRLMSKAI